jgi:integrase/recombinase XerD
VIALPAKVELPAGHPLASPVGDFLIDLAAAGKSDHTVRCYRGDLAQFAAHHAGGVTAIDATVLRGFFTAISGQAKATRTRKQAAIASFLAWCCRHDLLDADPMTKIDRVVAPQRQPRGVAPARVRRVLDRIPKRKLRDRVLFELIAATGLRAAEALGVYVEDLDLTPDDEHLTVTGKGDRQRTILLDDPAFLALLRRYLKATGYTKGPLFRAEKNNIGGPLRYSSAEELWRKYCRAADEKIELHQLRHTHGTELVNDGVPIETVRKRLGHRDIRSTLLYAEKTDPAADNEIRAWRRRRRTRPAPASGQPSTSDESPPPGTARTTARPAEKPVASPRNRPTCPSCGHRATTRPEAEQQLADLATTWLEPTAGGRLVATYHCAGCAPRGAVVDIACAACGDGPLLTGPAAEAIESGELPAEVRTWLDEDGWRLGGRTPTCPACLRKAGSPQVTP